MPETFVYPEKREGVPVRDWAAIGREERGEA
jgi:hypothetical protein